MIKGLACKPCEKRVERARQEKRRLSRDMEVVFKYLKGYYKDEGEQVFPLPLRAGHKVIVLNCTTADLD